MQHRPLKSSAPPPPASTVSGTGSSQRWDCNMKLICDLMMLLKNSQNPTAQTCKRISTQNKTPNPNSIVSVRSVSPTWASTHLNMKYTKIILILICLYAAVAKYFNPYYTFGGEKYRTPFYSSMFYIILLALILTI